MPAKVKERKQLNSGPFPLPHLVQLLMMNMSGACPSVAALFPQPSEMFSHPLWYTPFEHHWSTPTNPSAGPPVPWQS